MHDTALTLGARVLARHAQKEAKILDIGALDLNGSLRSVAPDDCHFTGTDYDAGPGVDVVITAGMKQLPFDDDAFDLVVTSSALEHDPRFWVTFLDALRVLK